MTTPSKSIDTLVEDIYEYISKGVPEDQTSGAAIESLGRKLSEVIGREMRQRSGKTELRMSNLGTPCERRLWNSIHSSDHAEPLSAPAKLKFLFGHILEELLLWLAEQAGHDVQGRQDECEINGVLGHRDAVIDGQVVDVKSASTYSFKKFQAHGLSGDDPFGYLTQLGGYLHAAQDDPLVLAKHHASFLVIDKTLGNICLDTYEFPRYNYERLVDKKRQILKSSVPPNRGFSDIPDGKSGNRRLGVSCSYCAFKQKCWPGLRTFVYSSGPVFLTSVVRLPNVPEARTEDVKVIEEPTD